LTLTDAYDDKCKSLSYSVWTSLCHPRVWFKPSDRDAQPYAAPFYCAPPGAWPLNNTLYATVKSTMVLNVATANNFTTLPDMALAFMTTPSHAVVDVTKTHTCAGTCPVRSLVALLRLSDAP
jgi:hypothetical protein